MIIFQPVEIHKPNLNNHQYIQYHQNGNAW